MSDLYEGTYNVNDGLELIIPTTFEEALTYAQQILWLYYNKQSELVEGDNITLTDNSDGTTTISCTLVENPGIRNIVGTVGPTGTQVVVTLTDDTTQSFFVEKGPAGADGRDGVDGQAATIAVGSVTTGQPGTSASVVNSGTSSAAVLDFTIPAGADGRDGVDGQAATIEVGSVTTGQPGTSASVVNSGTSSAAVLDFTIPAGADGQPGQTGPAGPGIAAGGTQGQFLKKNSGADYDTAWSDVNEVPAAGTQNQVLKKNSSTNYDVGWGDVNEVPSGGSAGDVLTQSANGPIWQAPSGGSSEIPTYTLVSNWSKINENLTISYNTYKYVSTPTGMHIIPDTDYDRIVWLAHYIHIRGITIVDSNNNTYRVRHLRNSSDIYDLILNTIVYNKFKNKADASSNPSLIQYQFEYGIPSTDTISVDTTACAPVRNSYYYSNNQINALSAIPVMGCYFDNNSNKHFIMGYLMPSFDIVTVNNVKYLSISFADSTIDSLSEHLDPTKITINFDWRIYYHL